MLEWAMSPLGAFERLILRAMLDGHKASIKAGYVYEVPGRCGDVQRVRYPTLARLPTDLGVVK